MPVVIPAWMGVFTYAIYTLALATGAPVPVTPWLTLPHRNTYYLVKNTGSAHIDVYLYTTIDPTVTFYAVRRWNNLAPGATIEIDAGDSGVRFARFLANAQYNIAP